MEQFDDNQFCFVCGPRNPQGLKLEFRYDRNSGEVVSEVHFAEHFQGWHGVLHGGLISTVMDEIMIKAAAHNGYKCVTVELNVRFKNPAMLEKSFTVKGKVKEARKRLVFAEASMTDSDNTTVATASGKFITVD
jgi:uncharacterized protein (TIGR00369 family)